MIERISRLLSLACHGALFWSEPTFDQLYSRGLFNNMGVFIRIIDATAMTRETMRLVDNSKAWHVQPVYPSDLWATTLPKLVSGVRMASTMGTS